MVERVVVSDKVLPLMLSLQRNSFGPLLGTNPNYSPDNLYVDVVVAVKEGRPVAPAGYHVSPLAF